VQDKQNVPEEIFKTIDDKLNPGNRKTPGKKGIQEII
jgi:hypothetical protein